MGIPNRRRADITNSRIHDLRHTFASWCVMEGVPLFEVSKLLRHASIQMTERYAHLVPDYLHDAVASLGFSARFQHTNLGCTPPPFRFARFMYIQRT